MIPGHTLTFDGVAHGSGAPRAERYCASCHGENLAGGAGVEPACLSCHGKNWLDATDSGEGTSPAPTDHTEIKEGFRHHASLMTPTGTCDACHGANLEGNPGLGQPSCLLCHDRNWQ